MFEDKNPEGTPLENLGEFALIQHLTRNFPISHASTVRAVGDDAAVLNFGNKQVLISTDLLIEGVHFDLSYMPLKHLGYKAVVVNVSDLCAMNATASQILVSLAVSNRFPLQALEALYEGIVLACEYYKLDLVGGDTTSSTTGMLLNVTAVGHALEKDIVYRSGAKANDLLVVSGDLGAAYMGLQVLEREKEVFKVNPNSQPDLSSYTYLVERQLKPEARKDIVELLAKMELTPTSMIDISDGLSSEILHLCKASGVGCHLYEEKIPLDPTVIAGCEEFQLDHTTVALSGGEEYELLFTIDQKEFPKIKGNPNLTVVGHMTEEQDAFLISRNNFKIPITAQGWNSFAKHN